MIIDITLTPQAESKLREWASASGQDIAAIASTLLEKAMTRPTVDEVLSPFRKQVAESGMNDQQLDDFFRTELEANRRMQREKSA